MNAAGVLVVDDSALVRAVVQRDLAPERYRVREAADGHQALEACAREVPDVILLDVEMPGLDGHETLRRLRADPALHDVPVLFLTGRTGAEDVAEGLRLGAHDYLRKPFETIELVARVRAAARTRRLQQELRARNLELERLAGVDPLTGLFNRRFLEEHAARVASRNRRHGGTMGVVLLDIDDFKRVNDTHGHATGDAALVAVARRLAEGSRLEDVLARWGGEEFLVLAPDTSVDGVSELAERMRAAVAAGSLELAGVRLGLTVSAGWAVGEDGVELDALLGAADRGLYAAKADGRNCVRQGE